VTAEDTVSLRQDRDMLVERIHGRAGVDAPPTSGEHVSCGTLKPPLEPAHPDAVMAMSRHGRMPPQRQSSFETASERDSGRGYTGGREMEREPPRIPTVAGHGLVQSLGWQLYISHGVEAVIAVGVASSYTLPTTSGGAQLRGIPAETGANSTDSERGGRRHASL
jgi:hypothetical protein